MDETLEAKLRNQLSPLYGIADLVLLMDENPEIKKHVIQMAKQASKNKPTIDLILRGIEAKTENKPDVLRIAFEAGREKIQHPDWDYVYEDFDAFIKQCQG